MTEDLWQGAAAVRQATARVRVDTLRDLDAGLKTIFGNSVTDIVTHHNQALDVYDAAVKQRLIPTGKPMALIHVDTHSDLYSGSGATTENIGNYINRLVSQGTVDSVYWVVPDATRSAVLRAAFWGSAASAIQQDGPVFGGGRAKKTIYVDKATGAALFEKPQDFATRPDGYRKVAFHTVLAAELPNLAAKRNLWLDIDADYFANCGVDTTGNAAIP